MLRVLVNTIIGAIVRVVNRAIEKLTSSQQKRRQRLLTPFGIVR
jgi:hypothetical protein